MRWNAGADLAQTITQNTAHISDEVLALSFEFDQEVAIEENELGVGVTLTKA